MCRTARISVARGLPHAVQGGCGGDCLVVSKHWIATERYPGLQYPFHPYSRAGYLFVYHMFLTTDWFSNIVNRPSGDDPSWRVGLKSQSSYVSPTNAGYDVLKRWTHCSLRLQACQKSTLKCQKIPKAESGWHSLLSCYVIVCLFPIIWIHGRDDFAWDFRSKELISMHPHRERNVHFMPSPFWFLLKSAWHVM